MNRRPDPGALVVLFEKPLEPRDEVRREEMFDVVGISIHMVGFEIGLVRKIQLPEPVAADHVPSRLKPPRREAADPRFAGELQPQQALLRQRLGDAKARAAAGTRRLPDDAIEFDPLEGVARNARPVKAQLVLLIDIAQ